MAEVMDTLDALTRPVCKDASRSQLAVDVQAALADELSAQTPGNCEGSQPLRAAMNYSLGLRGKRARGALTLLIVDAWGQKWRSGLDCACAIEMVHTSSLIFDDLPAMDNANMRRGRMTNHNVFSEPTAILAGIALLNDGFARLAASPSLTYEQRTIAVAALASAIGPDGMTGGQQRDLFPLGTDLAYVEITHAMKTGALFAAAAEIGCIAAGVSGPHKWMLSDFGMLLGKAFQEFDDLLDKCADLSNLGKDTDQDANTPTIVDLLGHEKAERRALRQIGMAFECLDASAADGAELRRYVLDLTRLMRAQIAGTEIQPMNQ